VVQEVGELVPEIIQDSELPARLLKIDRQQIKTFSKLVHTKSLDGQTRKDLCSSGYATLSYCWGASQPLTLQSATVATLEQGVDIDHLPKTLRDSILVTAEVGLNYIWIDALCIFQDDDLDKKVEIARMPLYYGRNTLTISAASSTKCTDGVLSETSAENCFRAGPFELSFSTAAGAGTVQLYQLAPRPPEPIDLRGWTFQESVLSRRVLIFASDQLHWCCNFGKASCGGPSAALTEQDNIAWDRDQTYTMNQFGQLTLDSWSDMVQSYTTRKVTVESDKLLAISALADRVVEVLRSSWPSITYVSGLLVIPDQIWSWIDQLIWLPRPGSARRASTYRAPSWSWACLEFDQSLEDLRVLIPRGHNVRGFDISFAVRDFFVDLSLPSAPFGSVRSAHLLVSGYMKSLSAEPAVEVAFPDSRTPVLRLQLHRPASNKLFLFPDTINDKELMRKALAGAESVFLLEVIPPKLSIQRSYPTAGLAIVESATDVFRRIGVFAFFATCDESGAATLDDYFDLGFRDVKLV